jgi:hypothetical protein
MKLLRIAILLCLYSLFAASNANALFERFMAIDARNEVEIYQRTNDPGPINCLPLSSSGGVCLSRKPGQLIGYDLCCSGVLIRKGIGDSGMRITKTPMPDVYILESMSSGSIGGMVYEILYRTNDEKLFITDLFQSSGRGDHDIIFSMRGKSLVVTFTYCGKKEETVIFNGKSTIYSGTIKGSRRPELKNILPADFIDLKKTLTNDETVKEFIKTSTDKVGKDVSPEYASMVLKKATLYSNPEIAARTLNIINMASFSPVREQYGYVVLEASENEEERDAVEKNLDGHVLMTINKFSGLVEMAWLGLGIDESVKREGIQVNYISDAQQFCPSPVVVAWAAKFGWFIDK